MPAHLLLSSLNKGQVSLFSKASKKRVEKLNYKEEKVSKSTLVYARLMMTTLIFVIFSTITNGQTLVQLVSGTNPLLGMQASSLNSSIRFVDIDADGDMDAFVGSASGQIEFFRNDGSRTIPAFNVISGGGNPFNAVFSPAGHSTLGFVDIDADGDMDVFLGDEDGDLYYYRNDGSATSASYTAVTGGSNPLDGINEGLYSNVFFVDIDGDGDQDAFVGSNDGKTYYYKNTGTAAAPVFAKQTGVNNPFDGEDVGERSYSVFGDLDCDGDNDAFFGNAEGNIRAYENTGTAMSPSFNELTGIYDPFGFIALGNTTPEWVDIDGDGDLDFFTGEDSGDFEYYQNTYTFTCDGFTAQAGASNPLDGVAANTISSSAAAFCDVDGDGDLDAIVGSLFNGLIYYENTGTKLAPSFTYVGGTGDAASPFFGMVIGNTAMPVTVDIDGDGDCDIFIGRTDGTIQYIRNDGGGTMTMVAGASNPFNGVDVGQRSAPTFGDIDGDGDQDCFIGEQNGAVFYYRNDGSSTSPAFTSVVGTANPLYMVSVFQNATPHLADLDKDGDLDAMVGRFNGILKYYMNNGHANTPVMSLVAGGGNPFQGVDVTSNANITLIDIDCDGDLDAFIGAADGSLYHYTGDGCPPLPVELAYFHAFLENNKEVVLRWMTASEENNEGFEIQRSFDGENWKTIDFVIGQGTTTEITTYEYFDANPLAGINYYRLKQVDLPTGQAGFDNEFEYSSIRVVELEGTQSISIYPNPVTDILNIEMDITEEVMVSIVGMNGQLIQQQILNNSSAQIDFTSLEAGIYIVKITGKTINQVEKIIKR